MYQFDSRVRYSEINEQGTLSVTGIMNYMQDCSTFHSEDAGVGVAYLSARNRAWMLSSWRIIIDRYPRLGESIIVGTWPYAFKGIYGYRNFVIRKPDGESLVRAQSVWFFSDTRTGYPIRVRKEDVEAYGEPEPKLDMGDAPRRVQAPKVYQEAQPVTVSHCHIDTNHHMNNAQYVVMAREAAPDAFMPAELRVDYKKAAVLFDVIVPRVARTEEGYVVALCGQDGTSYCNVWMRV